MNSDTKIIINNIEKRLINIEEISIAQTNRIQEQSDIIKQLYEELYKKTLKEKECQKDKKIT